MSILTKKYYSISEVAAMFNISASTLRYIERREPKLNIYKIKKRRYYSQIDIEQIKSMFVKSKNTQPQSDQHSHLLQINNLINIFKNIQMNLNKFLDNLKFIDT